MAILYRSANFVTGTAIARPFGTLHDACMAALVDRQNKGVTFVDVVDTIEEVTYRDLETVQAYFDATTIQTVRYTYWHCYKRYAVTRDTLLDAALEAYEDDRADSIARPEIFVNELSTLDGIDSVRKFLARLFPGDSRFDLYR